MRANVRTLKRIWERGTWEAGPRSFLILCPPQPAADRVLVPGHLKATASRSAVQRRGTQRGEVPMETKGGSLRLCARAGHSGKCGFRAVILCREERTQDGTRASLSVQSRWVPRVPGFFPDAAGVGEATEA